MAPKKGRTSSGNGAASAAANGSASTFSDALAPAAASAQMHAPAPDNDLANRSERLDRREAELDRKQTELGIKENGLNARETDLLAREGDLNTRDSGIRAQEMTIRRTQRHLSGYQFSTVAFSAFIATVGASSWAVTGPAYAAIFAFSMWGNTNHKRSNAETALYTIGSMFAGAAVLPRILGLACIIPGINSVCSYVTSRAAEAATEAAINLR